MKLKRVVCIANIRVLLELYRTIIITEVWDYECGVQPYGLIRWKTHGM